MRIAVDAMGGDYAPGAIVEGAVLAAREFGSYIILVGIKDRVDAELEKYDDRKLLPIKVCHADEIVEMSDIPVKALRTKKKSSMKIGMDLVKSGEAAAFVSAGNTGAVLAYSTVILRPLKGVDRPAIAVQLPTMKGPSILIDAGANVDCKSLQLFQFAVMGHVFAKYILGREKPTVGILSIGEEDVKGNEITKEVFQMLEKSHLNFIGNVEGKAVYRGNADVIVCDGFTGNVALKISQSLAEMIGDGLKGVFKSSLKSKLGYLMLKPAFSDFKKSVDYSETGGAPLLGVNGICIIAHGSSSPKAVKNAIKRAQDLIDKKINQHIQEDIEDNLEGQDLWSRRGAILNQIKDTLSFGSSATPENNNDKNSEKASDPQSHNKNP